MMGLPRRTRGSREPPPEPDQCPRTTLDIASTPIASKSNESPPWFGDSSPIENSQSPVPFMCTQDVSCGDNDVVWNYYSPKARRKHKKPLLGTPLAKKKEKLTSLDFSPISSMPVKKKLSRQMHKDYLKGLKEELTAINKHVQTLMCKEPENEIASTSSHVEILPLKNRISEKISKCESEGIESDDSMNEYLLRASQMVEEEILEKNVSNETLKVIHPIKKSVLNNIAESPSLATNDSFDNLIGSINDSYIEILTQAPVKKKLVNEINNIATNSDNLFDDSWTNISNFSSLLNSSIVNDAKSKFTRHKSMPVTPAKEKTPKNKSSTTFGRHNSMPDSGLEQIGTSAASCSNEEIKRKHQLAREKLLAKKQEKPLRADAEIKLKKCINLVKENSPLITQDKLEKSTNGKITISSQNTNKKSINNNLLKEVNVQNEIERKRREALQRLQKKRSQILVLKK